jgi:hypothetical protein
MPARLVVCCAVSFAFLGMTVTAGERRVKDVSGRREILSLNVGNTDRYTRWTGGGGPLLGSFFPLLIHRCTHQRRRALLLCYAELI